MKIFKRKNRKIKDKETLKNKITHLTICENLSDVDTLTLLSKSIKRLDQNFTGVILFLLFF